MNAMSKRCYFQVSKPVCGAFFNPSRVAGEFGKAGPTYIDFSPFVSIH